MKKAFTLIELLVVVGIVAILAAIGTPMYLDYIGDVRDENVKNDLSSIYLKNLEFMSDNGNFFITGTGDQTNNINNFLQLNIDNSDYDFTIRSVTNGYSACARLRTDGFILFCIDHRNRRTRGFRDSSGNPQSGTW
jgi:type IV pilus assembly protein PilE